MKFLIKDLKSGIPFSETNPKLYSVFMEHFLHVHLLEA